MQTNQSENNDVNGVGTIGEDSSSGRCPVEPQHRPGRHQTTAANARMKWTKVNVAVMECFYQSRPFSEEGRPIRGYRQRMHSKWKERLLFPEAEQRLCDQARMIRKNGWLTPVELEEIRRRVMQEEHEAQGTLWVEANDEGARRDENNDGIDTNSDENVQHIITADNGQSGENVLSETNVLTDIEQATEEEEEIARRIVELMNNMEEEGACDFKKVDKSRVDEETRRVNSVLKYIDTKNLSETNKLLKAVSIYVAERLGIKNKRGLKRNNEPWWKRRIENDINRFRKDIAVLERKRTGELRREGKFKFLQKKYNLYRKGLAVAIEELKQRVTAKKA